MFRIRKAVQIWRCGVVLILAFTLNACGLHLRDGSAIPPPLRVMHLDTTDSYSAFTEMLKSNLAAWHIQLVSKQRAPITLRLLSITFHNDNPRFSSTTIALNIHYYFTVQAQLVSAKNKTLIPVKTFEAVRTVTLNTNDVLTQDAASLVINELYRDIINQIYFWLVAQNTLHSVYPQTGQTNVCK